MHIVSLVALCVTNAIECHFRSVLWVYKLSHMYYSVIAMVVAVVVGIIVSLITGMQRFIANSHALS